MLSIERKRVRIDDNVEHMGDSGTLRGDARRSGSKKDSKSRNNKSRSSSYTKSQQPLIPSHILDEPFQRMFVISVFVLIQSWKLYDILAMNVAAGDQSSIGVMERFTFLLKYCIIDGLFLWFIPILNISYFIFSPLFTLTLTIIFNIINVLLVSKFNMSMIITIVSPIWQWIYRSKELTVGGDTISSKAIDMESHLKGSYTLHYLPDSLVKFNAFDFHDLCLDSHMAKSQHLQIPVEFNTTTDIGYLELKYTSPFNQISYLQYTGSELKRLMKRDYSHLKQHKGYVSNDYRVFYLEIPVREPGSYSLNKVRDISGSGIRYMLKSFAFTYCPSALFSGATGRSPNYLCMGDDVDTTVNDYNDMTYDINFPLLSLSGVPPLEVKILTKFNGKSHRLIQSKIDLDISQNELALKNFTEYKTFDINRNVLEQEILKSPSLLHMSKSGTMDFQLLEVIDSHGNSKKYNPSSDSHDVRFSLSMLTKPQVQFIDPAPSQGLLVNGTKALTFKRSQSVSEQFPINAEFEYINTNDQLLSFNFTKTFNTMDELEAGITIDRPGVYKLLKMKGNHCPCSIDRQNQVTVKTIEPPTVDIDPHPLLEKCVGMTGYKFKFKLLGKAPFLIDYSVYHNGTNGKLSPVMDRNGRSSRTIRTDDYDHQFNYKPPGEGAYVIIFKSLRDANYRNVPINIDQSVHTYLTYFKQRSKVSFMGPNLNQAKRLIHTCKGESRSVPIYFSGNFPFTFDYKIVNSKTNVPVIHKEGVHVTEPVFNAESPKFVEGGRYKVLITNINDGISCSADQNHDESVEILSRQDIPQVSFDFKSNVEYYKVVEGDTIEVPLKVESSLGRTSKDSIEYQFQNHDGTGYGKNVVGGTNKLRLSKSGIYKLSSFSNAGCPGVISSEKQVHISYYERPSVKAQVDPSLKHAISTDNEILLTPACQIVPRTVTLDLFGAGPYVIDYEIKFPSGKIEARSMTADKDSLTISLPNGQSGVYVNKFKGIYDTRYTKAKFSKLSDFSKKSNVLPTISYEVYESPSIEFTGTSSVQFCEASIGYDILQSNQIPIEVSGKSPFKLNISVLLETSSKPKKFMIDNVDGSYLNLANAVDTQGKPIWSDLQKGDYLVMADSIIDSNGCSKNDFSDINSFMLLVTPAPSINKMPSSKGHYCVGDHVGYDLDGVPPYTMYYEFNGQQHKAKTKNQFRRLAARSGAITVSGIEDSSANNCFVGFTDSPLKQKELTITINELPSVEINQGGAIVEDIHEGEQTEMKFSFTGTPPFSVTYVRMLDPSSKAKRSSKSKFHQGKDKIIETKTISDIWDNEHSVMVGLEGTYEAIEIKDAYCVARREI